MADNTFTSRLRELADWLEKNDYPVPQEITKDKVLFDFGYQHEPEKALARLQKFVKLFGSSEKGRNDYYFTLTRKEPVAGFILFTRCSKSTICEKREYEETEEGDGYTITRKVEEYKCAHSILAGVAS